MKKAKINRFVSKYNLAGLVESVKWETKDGDLSTSFISDDKSVLGTVTLDFDITKADEKAISLKFKDGSTSVNYMLADLSVIPNVPDLKQLPEFNITINLDDVFINRFIKSKVLYLMRTILHLLVRMVKYKLS